jgi:hypothetical protein
MMLSPDVKTENKEKDLDLWELTDKLVMWLEKKLGRDIPYIGAVHNNTENPHVHTILLVERFGREKPITVPVINQLRLLAAGQALEQQRKRSEPEPVVVFSPGQAAQEARAWLETLHAGMVIAEAWAEELASRQAARPSVRLEGRPLVQQPTVRLRHPEQQPGSFPSLRHARLRESGDLSPSVRSAGTPASVAHPLAQQPLTGRAGGSSPARHHHHYRLPTLCPRCGQFHEFGECEARKEEKSRERRI